MANFSPPDAFVLLPGDRVSSTWLRLKAHLEQELATARVKNDDAKLDEIQTAITRGRIQTLKQILSLETTSPVIPTDG